MNFAEYQGLAERTVNKKLGPRERPAMAALGLAGESGEVADMIKKYLYHGHELAIEDVIKELGDVLWYLAVIASTFGTTLEYIAERNICKLIERYPDGFSEFDSINRKG